MGYDKKVNELKKHNKIAGIIAIVLGTLSGAIMLPVILDSKKGSSQLFMLFALLLPAAVIIVGICLMLLTDKRLKKMWASVGIYDKNEIAAMFDKRHVFDEYDGDYFITDDIIVNLSSLKAYRTSAIKNISTSDIRDSDNEGRNLSTYTYIINFKLNSNAAHKKDIMSFNSKKMRDSAYDMIFGMTSLN
ncbi:hypothetical protein [Ruminococcus flavefaciens]|uniref:hypothetical protein n=1 Tax=Ruminococcus flavefaciens TaxID=1265 RepID=UPI0026F1C2DC|nr:hypothetical protein [Ruminococcus flavefaciens]